MSARKRFTAATATTAVVALTLMGCSSGGDEEGSNADGKTTLTVASYHWLEAGRGDRMWDAVRAYADENPDVEVVKQEITRAEYERTLSTQIGSGGGADIIHVPDPYFFELMDSGALEPMDGVLEDADAASLTAQNELYVIEDVPYAFVWETAGYGLFWNETILEEVGVEAPTSFEGVVQAAKDITAETGSASIATRHVMSEEAAWFNDHYAWIYGVGGAWSDGENLTINSPENIQAETYFKELYDSGAFAIGDDSPTFREKFAQGNMGMLIDAAGGVGALLSGNTTVPADTVGASAIPFPSQGALNVGSALAINANSKNKDVARDFMKWFYQEEPQLALAEGMFPSLVGRAIEVPAHLVEDNPWFPPIYEMLQGPTQPILIRGFEQEIPQLRTIILKHIQRILAEDVAPKQALDDAQAEAEALLGL